MESGHSTVAHALVKRMASKAVADAQPDLMAVEPG